MLDKSTFTPHGKHLIAGDWVAGETTFESEPAHGPVHAFSVGTPDLVERAAKAAEEAFWSYGYSTREERAKFLDTIADEIEARGEQITEIGTQETGLPEARLQGERG
ncbi:aldehyde dehydrogenase family protein, partial [Salipiger mucosus]|uniref:aldehyde dehydrogenase family protein n=1 Tax=Salipiger mucosus TaxID=263378 RepID=UPI0005629596